MKTERLPVVLTDSELKEKGQLLAALEEERNQKEVEAKRVAKEFKDDLDELKGDIRRAALTINDGFELRPVEVFSRKNLDLKVREWVRKDTGEIFRTDPLTAEDLQGELFAAPFDMDMSVSATLSDGSELSTATRQ